MTLTGVGGVGKTRLAVHGAAELVGEFSNVWFVPLADVAGSTDVESAVAVAIGTTGTSDPLSAMRTLLAVPRTLLVIDNCEHVVEGAAAVADALTAQLPELHVLATGREALAIEGEHVVPVRPLDGSTTAVELFRERAAAVGPTSAVPSGPPSSTSAPVSMACRSRSSWRRLGRPRWAWRGCCARSPRA